MSSRTFALNFKPETLDDALTWVECCMGPEIFIIPTLKGKNGRGKAR
jgi:hypothetical protein